MGLLTLGTPLCWEKTKEWSPHIRQHGIKQFISLYRKLQSRKKDVLYWGDELEYMLLKFDHENKKVRLSLRAADVLASIQDQTKTKIDSEIPTTWHCEFTSYMLESTPGKPYGGMIAHLNTVQSNMEQRRKELVACLEDDEALMTLTTFPRLGCLDFTSPSARPEPRSGLTKSIFLPDKVINTNHPRFMNLARNTRERRGSKVVINVPIYKDVNTPSPFKEDFSHLCDEDDTEALTSALSDHIYMDATSFGFGQCCLQVTFQACSIDEAVVLYDQLAVLTPIMLALSASSPIFRGHLSDIDVRWPVLVESLDDRTEEERKVKPLQNDRFVIPKSRYESISCYISPDGQPYNDLPVVKDGDVYQQLVNNNIPATISQHLSHLFIRDSVSAFQENLDQDDDVDTDHFENINTTVWNNMRFKPPPANSQIGWRVEFRPMDVQLTDFENAAYTVFMALVTRVILTYRLNMLIPISKLDANMKTACDRDAVLNGRFYFRNDDLTQDDSKQTSSCSDDQSAPPFDLMTINEIFHGKGEYPGLIPLINLYISSMEIDADTRCTIMQYINLISLRASGELNTAARWIRDFVGCHPEYKKDSQVSDRIVYDLLWRINQISLGKIQDPKLIFDQCHRRSSGDINPAVSMAEDFINTRSPPSDAILHPHNLAKTRQDQEMGNCDAATGSSTSSILHHPDNLEMTQTPTNNIPPPSNLYSSSSSSSPISSLPV